MSDRVVDIHIEDLSHQNDGRYRLVFVQDGKTFIQENISLCCMGSHHNDTGNDSDSRYYNIHFEVLTCFHSPREIENYKPIE